MVEPRRRRPRGTMHAMIDRDELIDAISGFGLFADLSAPQLEAIIHIFDERMFAEGETIVHQGLSGSGFFVIVDGEALVTADGRELARLGRGDFFGELSVLDGHPRVAQVIADEPTVCLALASWDFEAVVKEQPAVALGVMRGLAGRLRELTEAHRH